MRPYNLQEMKSLILPVSAIVLVKIYIAQY